MLRSCLAVICLAELLALGATTAPQEPSRRLCVMLSRLRGGMPDMFPWERPYKTNAERWAEAGVSLQVWGRCRCRNALHVPAAERVRQRVSEVPDVVLVLMR